MNKFPDVFSTITKDQNLSKKINPETLNKITNITDHPEIEIKYETIIDILVDFDSKNFYFPEIYSFFFENLENFLSLDNDLIVKVLNSIDFWQDWKSGLKLVEKVNLLSSISKEKWFLLSNLSFKLGQLCYNLFKGSNYPLTLLFFEKTLKYISKSPNNRETMLIFSATLWFIGTIEFEKGYSIKASDYQLSSIYYQKEFIESEFDLFFQSDRKSMRNSFILSTFQASTEYFIASKVCAQSFQMEVSKNYLHQSYSYINRILRILRFNEENNAILEQIKTFLLQLHIIIDKEAFLTNHSCDLQLLSSLQLEHQVLIDYVNNHMLLLDDKDKKLIWLTVLDKSGISLFEYDFEEGKITSKNTLYSSFIHVISRWGEVELESGPVQELNFLGNSFIIELAGDIEVIAVVTKPTTEFHYSIKNFATNFYNEFKLVLNPGWDGNIKIFEEKSLELIQNIKKTN